MAQRSPYLPDEFDDPPAKGVPVGVHRVTPRLRNRVLTFVTVFVLFGALAYGAVQLLFNYDRIPFLSWLGDGPPAESPFVTPSPGAGDPEPTSTASASPQPSPEYRLNADIRVLKASSAKDLATDVRDYLKSEGGFTKVRAGTWGGAEPTGNVIRYRSTGYRDTADRLAELLGIPVTALGPVSAGDIEILLVSNPLPEPEPSPSAS